MPYECALCVNVNLVCSNRRIYSRDSFISFTIPDPDVDHHSLWVPRKHLSPTDFMHNKVNVLLTMLECIDIYVSEHSPGSHRIVYDFGPSLNSSHSILHLLWNNHRSLPRMFPTDWSTIFI